MWDTVTSP